MKIEIRKDTNVTTREIDVAALPRVSVANIITIGFRNMPTVGEESWVEGDGTVTVEIPSDDLFAAGLDSIVNDAHASVTTKTEPDADKRFAAAVALADKKIANLVAGIVRAGGGGKRLDPIKARTILIAANHILARLKSERKPALKGKDLRRAALAAIDKNPAFAHVAEAQIRMEKEAGIYDADADVAAAEEGDDSAE